MAMKSYNQFCPTAMAAELLEPRWTMLVLCEMGSGSTRFSDIQRGVPGMSPSLLARRLRELEDRGLVRRETVAGTGQPRYRTTPMADELLPLIHAIGAWAHRNLDAKVQLDVLDHRLLMWNIRRKVLLAALPSRRTVVQFILSQPDQMAARYWLIMRPGHETDLCSIDPRFDVDLYVNADLRAMTAAWMGHSTFSREIRDGRIMLTGDSMLERSFEDWLVRSSFAGDGACRSAPAPDRGVRAAH